MKDTSTCQAYDFLFLEKSPQASENSAIDNTGLLRSLGNVASLKYINDTKVNQLPAGACCACHPNTR